MTARNAIAAVPKREMDNLPQSGSHARPIGNCPNADTSAAQPIVPKDSPLAEALAAAAVEHDPQTLPMTQGTSPDAVSSRARRPQQQVQLDASLSPKQQGSTRGILGNAPSRSQLDEVFRNERLQGEREFRRKWNFDAQNDQPVPGQWKYESVG